MLFKDKEAFRSVFTEFYNPLCNYANNILRNETTAEDLVQDVFCKLWEKNQQLNHQHTLKSYLFQAVKNRVLEFFRSQKAQNKAIENAVDRGLLSAEADQMADVFSQFERLNSLLRHLPPKCKEVFVLHKFNGLTYAEIADKKDIAIKTVENHMLKAIKILRSHSTKK